MGRVLVGTSGFVYPHWKGILYPEDLPQRLWLDRYAREFPTVELNATFYRLPRAEVVDHHGAAFCEHDLIRLRPPRLTGGFRYLRFHGRAGKYRGRYGARYLAPFARELSRFARQGEGDAFVYFNNDVGGQAVHDARDFLALLPEAQRPASSRTASAPDPRRTPSPAPGRRPPRGRR